MKDKKRNFILFVVSVLIIGAFLILLDKIRTAEYLSKTTNIALSYPKKSTKIEVIKDNRAIVDEHVKFEISNRKFEENLIVEFLVIKSPYIECCEVNSVNSSPDDLSPQKICEVCGYFEELTSCKIAKKSSSYCPYYKERFISEEQFDPYNQRFGPVIGYFSRTSNWKKAPDNFQGEWPEGKTRKTYSHFIMRSNNKEIGKNIYIITWFKTGDKKAEKAADRIARYEIEILE